MSVTITKVNGVIDFVQISYESVKPFYDLIDLLWNTSEVLYDDPRYKSEMNILKMIMEGKLDAR